VTLCEVSPGSASTTPARARTVDPSGIRRTNEAATDAPTDAPTWGWAVVEIRRDGSWGVPRVVPATGPVEATATAAATAVPGTRQLRELPPILHAHLGSLHVSNGNLHEAVAAFIRGTRVRASSPGRVDCLGRLAHVVALQGDLRSASRLASMVPKPAVGITSPGFDHAQMARSWIALERAEFAQTRLRLEVLDHSSVADEDPWLATSVLLAEARLLIATGQPDAATRLLVGASEVGLPAGGSGWFSDLVTVARAEALLASGEPQRSLAALTPMPVRAGAGAAVVAAAALRGIGDVRGAQAVLSRVVGVLDREPLALQIQAWLLESRLAEDRGKHDRAHFMLDRALRSATAEQMRWPLMQEWRWLRGRVDRDPSLLRSHRDFLSTCQTDEAAPRWRTPHGKSDDLLGAPLTEREGQVLDLLAQMYSTEEIAAALYVSSNTVKTHLKGIFGKLCVNRRVDAVRRGRQLGLC
jgi:LuxR family maltose regulon positive regulatory protein